MPSRGRPAPGAAANCQQYSSLLDVLDFYKVLPALFDVRKCRVGDSVCLTELLDLAGDGCGSGERSGARRPDDRSAHHGGGRVESVVKYERAGESFPSRDLELPMGGGDDGGDGTRRRSSLQWAALAKNRSHSTVTQTMPGAAPNESAAETHENEPHQTSS